MQRITWNGRRAARRAAARIRGLARLRADAYGFAEKLFEKTWIGMRVIISPDNAEPVDSPSGAVRAKAEAIAAVPAKAEALPREAAEAARTATRPRKPPRRRCARRLC